MNQDWEDRLTAAWATLDDYPEEEAADFRAVIDALAAEVRKLTGNRLDILVSNAGISKAAPIESITVKDFDDLFAVNVRAPYFLLQQLLPILSDNGSVVFVSSLGARAAALWSANLSPNAIAIDIDRERHESIVHDVIVNRASERPA